MSPSRRRSGALTTPFRPPCCPNADCRFHLPSTNWRWKRDGWYHRASDQRPFQRFQCLQCGRRFSTRTFSPTYWLKKPRLQAPIAQLSANGAGLRQMARCLDTTHRTVARQLARLGRHCLLYHARLLQKIELQEPVVVDGFESFEYSQFFPFHLHLAAGQRSWFLYGFTDSPLRRKGRMRPEQRARRRALETTWGRPDPQAVETGMAQLVELIASRVRSGRLELHSDEHPAYPRALRRVRKACREQEGASLTITHRRTPSVEARTYANPLFAVNLTDLLIRHSHANHRRETIAFSKRRQAAIERMAVFLVWRNLIKKRREKKGKSSAAMYLGVRDRVLEWKDVLKRRLFPRQTVLPPPWLSYYWRRVRTPVLGRRQESHELKYAF